MTLRGRGPWVVSAALHGAALLAALVLWTQPEEPTPLRMHFVVGQKAPESSRRVSLAAPNHAAPPQEPALPAWREARPQEPGVSGVAAPVSLDELLVSPQKSEPTPEGAWEGASGDGLAYPPLPPPSLVPPQGAVWRLTMRVPASGGLADIVEGLDSGHPTLDRWLEEYLRTVGFPTSLDGSPYEVRWTLRLKAGRPQ